MANKNLIVYFTHSGNTKKIAQIINAATEGTLCEIKPQNPYPQGYKEVVEQAKKEIQAFFLPELQEKPDNISGYDTIFIGTPNWWSTIAPPIASFLSGSDLAGKKILPFCTHGGGGLAKIPQDIAKLCPNSKVLECLEIYGDGGKGAEEKIDNWLQHNAQ